MFTPWAAAGPRSTSTKSNRLWRDVSRLGFRRSLQHRYSIWWIGRPSAYKPGLMWGTRPTQLTCSGGLAAGVGLAFLVAGVFGVLMGRRFLCAGGGVQGK